jgi:DHA3 family macrolide efflux protein-like MFS transporter
MKLQGMRSFLTIWFGQVLSLFGTHMTRFALLIWAYELTGQATTMALLGVFSLGSLMLFSPIAGYWVDKLDRRMVMLWADMGAGIVILFTLLLVLFGNLELWHLYLGQALIGGLEAFQSTAYTAASSVLVEKEQYGRVNGLRYLATSIAEIGAPIFGAMVLVTLQIQGVLLLNMITFLFSVLFLMLVDVPHPVADEEEEEESAWQQLKIGWDYIVHREGLMGLLLLGNFIELLASITYMSIFPAMILARTNGDEYTLSLVQAAIGVGGVLGSIVMSVWGGPKRKIHGTLGLTAASFILGDILFGIGQTNLVWVFAAVATALFFPFMVGCEMAIWQEKVPAYMQGRVLNIVSTFRNAALVIGYLAGGLLADHIFEPAMLHHGTWLADTFGGMVGTGAGAGMALMFVITGILGAIAGLVGYFYAPLRNVEADLPDTDAPIFNKQPLATSH